MPFLWVTGLLLAGGYAWLMKQAKEAERLPVGDSPALLRMQAFESLMDEGPGAIPDLIEQLSSKEVAQRRLAVIGLGRLGHQAESAVPALMSRFDDEDSEVRSLILYALARINSNLEPLIPDVIRRLQDPSGEVRLSAARLLVLYGPAGASATIAALLEGGPGTSEALQVLRHTAVDVEETREALRQLRADSRLDDSLRAIALRMLLAIGDSSIDEVGEGLSSSDYTTWQFAVEQISNRGEEFATFLPALQKILMQSQAQDGPLPMNVQHGILPALGKLGASARLAVPVIEQLALDDSLQPSDRFLAMRTLHQIETDCSRYIPVIQQLMSQVCDDRLSSLHDLKLFAELLSAIVPELVAGFVERVIPMLDSPDSATRSRACYILGEIGPAAIAGLPAARALLRTGNADERLEAARLIAAFGPAARAALPDLIAELEYRNDQHNEWGIGIFARAIRCVTSRSEPAFREIHSTMRVEHIDIREWVIDNPTDRVLVLEFYRRALKAPDSSPVIAEELIRLRAETDAVVRLLLDRLSGKVMVRQRDPAPNVHTVRLLENLGPRATVAIDPLIGMLEGLERSRTAEASATICAILKIIGSPEAAQKMPRAIQSRLVEAVVPFLQFDACRDAADILGLLGPSARSAIPALEELLLANDVGPAGAFPNEVMTPDRFRSPVFRLARQMSGEQLDERELLRKAVCRAIEQISGQNGGNTK